MLALWTLPQCCNEQPHQPGALNEKGKAFTIALFLITLSSVIAINALALSHHLTPTQAACCNLSLGGVMAGANLIGVWRVYEVSKPEKNSETSSLLNNKAYSHAAHVFLWTVVPSLLIAISGMMQLLIPTCAFSICAMSIFTLSSFLTLYYRNQL